MKLNTLSGRFALLTLLFVLLAEVLILIPALSNWRIDYLESRLERAQIASLALLATDSTLAADLEQELLQNAGVYNVVLRRNDVRQLVLSSPIPGPVEETFDLRNLTFWSGARDAIVALFDRDDQVARVIGAPVNDAGQLIEITLPTGPLRTGMTDFGARVLVVSAMIAILTALLLNLAAQRLILVPMRRVISHMVELAAAPAERREAITPGAPTAELREAEVAFASLQTSVAQSLRQRERLANLGEAVAKISHDLRNILTTSQIFADRLEDSADPAVRRAAPKLVNSIRRAISLCETTLTYGKAEEPAPALTRFNLAKLISEVAEAEALAAGDSGVELITDVPAGLYIRADRDQIYRVLANLVRNARQAIEATGRPGTVEIGAGEDEALWWMRVGDTGPGLPEKAREGLFKPFAAGGRKGGTGLGLAIAADLVRGHGGRLELGRTGPEGTDFILYLPRPPDIGAV